MRILVIAIFLAALAGTALAQDGGPYDGLADDAYVTEFFGTTLVATLAEQLSEDPMEWWGNMLPESLFYDQATLIEAVNAHRSETGNIELDTDGWLIEIGEETETADGWEYTIRFFAMRPSEVALILDEMGGAEALLPGGQYTFMPCLQRNFFADIGSLDEMLVVQLAEQPYSFDPRLTIDEMYAELELALFDAYGQEVYFDLYVYSFMMQDGSLGSQIDLYAELPAG